jgi:outer membrane receptor protein involved in Fe transport
VLKRISGASIQDNKFVIIRGLNDRYNIAMLNGGTLPSSEPDRKAFSFDIFPSNMLDNLIITKTATPDLPGEFAGGVIQINTKAVPDKDFQSISVGSGYNTITTFKTQKTYKGSPTDILGFDNGSRALPSSFPSRVEFAALTPQERLNVTKILNYDWGIKDARFKPNTSLQYTLGKQYNFDEKVFGLLFSLTHSMTNNFNEITRLDYDESPRVLASSFTDNNYSEQILTAAMANFALKWNANNTISFKNIYSINSTDVVVERSGKPDINDPLTIISDLRWFTSNKIYSGQLNGEHYFETPKIKLNWTGFYSNIDRFIPLRRNAYNIGNPNSTNPDETIPQASIGYATGSPDNGGQMFFSENQESILGAKFDLSRKFNIGEEFTNEIKIGAFAQERKRDFFSRQLFFVARELTNDISKVLTVLPNETIFSQANLGEISPGVKGFSTSELTKSNDAYDAGSKLNAAYLMFDNKYRGLRLIWGARFEKFAQTLNTIELDKPLQVNFDENDFLPSANLIYAIDKKQNLRFSFSKTLNRPEYREIAPFLFYDFTTRLNTQGNPNLKTAQINNYDFRYEIYPGKGQLFSVSYFRKDFTNPIELKRLLNKTISYANASSAKNSGIELEFRTLLSSVFTAENTTIFDDITLFSNLAIIKSKADISNLKTPNQTERLLQGQSPFVINAGVQYLSAENGWAFSANLNRAGNRLFVGAGEQTDDPEIWEKARTIIDMQIAKTFMDKKFEIKLNIQNILAQDQIFYENRTDIPYDYRPDVFEAFANMVFTGSNENAKGYNPDVDDARWITKFGRSFSFSLTYNF